MPFLDRVPTRLRLAVLLLAAVSAGVIAAIRVADFGPHVEAYAITDLNDAQAEYHTLRMRARGGEDLGRVRIEALTDGVAVNGRSQFEQVPAGMRFSTGLRVEYGDETQNERVKVWVEGHEELATTVVVTRRAPPR